MTVTCMDESTDYGTASRILDDLFFLVEQSAKGWSDAYDSHRKDDYYGASIGGHKGQCHSFRLTLVTYMFLLEGRHVKTLTEDDIDDGMSRSRQRKRLRDDAKTPTASAEAESDTQGHQTA